MKPAAPDDRGGQEQNVDNIELIAEDGAQDLIRLAAIAAETGDGAAIKLVMEIEDEINTALTQTKTRLGIEAGQLTPTDG